MYCFATFLLAVTIVSTGEATKAADAELFETLLDRSAGATKIADAEQYETMLDRSASLMDRSALLQEDRQKGEGNQNVAEGDECDTDNDCESGLQCLNKNGALRCSQPDQQPGSSSSKAGSSQPGSSNECPAGWIPLNNTCGATDNLLCVTVGAPLKYVSWLHLQYQCDAIGGYLPEPTADNKVNLELILSSIDALYAKGTPILMYLGATDVTHTNEWKWLKSSTDLADKDVTTNWTNDTPPVAGDNKDCLAQQSSDKLWTNVDCENDSMPNQIANICFGSPDKAKALPVA